MSVKQVSSDPSPSDKKLPSIPSHGKMGYARKVSTLPMKTTAWILKEERSTTKKVIIQGTVLIAMNSLIFGAAVSLSLFFYPQALAIFNAAAITFVCNALLILAKNHFSPQKNPLKKSPSSQKLPKNQKPPSSDKNGAPQEEIHSSIPSHKPHVASTLPLKRIEPPKDPISSAPLPNTQKSPQALALSQKVSTATLPQESEDGAPEAQEPPSLPSQEVAPIPKKLDETPFQDLFEILGTDFKYQKHIDLSEDIDLHKISLQELIEIAPDANQFIGTTKEGVPFAVISAYNIRTKSPVISLIINENEKAVLRDSTEKMAQVKAEENEGTEKPDNSTSDSKKELIDLNEDNPTTVAKREMLKRIIANRYPIYELASANAIAKKSAPRQ